MIRYHRDRPRRIAVFALCLPIISVCLLIDRAYADSYSVEDVLSYLGRKAGVIALAGSLAAKERARMPAADTKITPENVERYIQDLVKAMPEGATWAKLYLPAPPTGKEWTGDDVITFALAQAKLYGIVGAPRADEKVEIFSQLLPPDKAKNVISALNLKPVYVVTAGKGNFTGTWNSTYGEMVLRQSGRRVTGTYTFGHGEIEGTINRDTLQFRWIERDSGSSGTGEFILAKDGDSFRGPWGYDGRQDESPGEWTGTRISRR
jgi:hypothetical protein